MAWTSEVNQLRKGEMALAPSFPFSKSCCNLSTSVLHSGWSWGTWGSQTFPASVVLLCYEIGERASGKHFDKYKEPKRGQEFQILGLKTLKPYTNVRCLGCFPAFEIEFTRPLHTQYLFYFILCFKEVSVRFMHTHIHTHTTHINL